MFLARLLLYLHWIMQLACQIVNFMLSDTDINRFVKAQSRRYDGYDVALKEIVGGYKSSCWMWYIFPQFRDFARSETAYYYGLVDKVEAAAYLRHELLGARLRRITAVLLMHVNSSAVEIFGTVDACKLHTCMTIFDLLSPDDVFAEVLEHFFAGERDKRVMEIMNRKNPCA